MKSLLIALIFNCLIFALYTKAQDISKILPMNSSRETVTKLLGEGQKINESKTVYDLPDQKLIVYYYADSCSEDFLKKYELTKDTVMSVTIFPKKEIKIDGWEMSKLYRRFELLNGKTAYFQVYDKIVLTKSREKNEFTEIIYHLPQTLWSDACSRKYLDEDSGINLYDELQNRLEKLRNPHNRAFSTGSYFSSDSISTKKESVQVFCQELNKYPKGVGLVSIFLKETEKQSRYAFYENYLKQQMQRNKCNLSQIKFVKGGVSGKRDETFIYFWVMTENIELSN